MRPISLLCSMLLLFVSLFSLIYTVFSLSGSYFFFSVVLIVCLLALAALSSGAISYDKPWGWSFLASLSLVVLVYILGLYAKWGSLSLPLAVTIVCMVLLFGISVINYQVHDEHRKRFTKAPDKIERRAIAS